MWTKDLKVPVTRYNSCLTRVDDFTSCLGFYGMYRPSETFPFPKKKLFWLRSMNDAASKVRSALKSKTRKEKKRNYMHNPGVLG